MRRLLWWIAPAWAVAASTYLLFAPTVATMTTSVSLSRGGEFRSSAVSGSSSLLASQGASVLVPVLLPVLLTTLPLYTKRLKFRRVLGVSAAALLVPFCLIGMMTIGLWYSPCIPALLAATILERSDALPSDAAA